MSLPLLSTNRLILSELDFSDTQNIYNLFNEKNLLKYLDNERPKNLNEAHKLVNEFRKNKSMFWSLQLKKTNDFIGLAGFYAINIKHRFAQTKLVLSNSFQHQNYMNEAFTELCTYVFNHNILHRIEAQVHIKNIKTQQFLLKMGFKQEAVLRENFYLDNQFSNSILFSLLKTELNKEIN